MRVGRASLRSVRGLLLDKAGRPYIEHPLGVMKYVATKQERLVAVSHDILEDTSTTPDELLQFGCPAEVVNCVQLHHQAARRNLGYELAINVKLADFANNADPTRLILLPRE